MTAAVVLAGPALPIARCAEILRDLAPLVMERPIAWCEVERQVLEDLDRRGACWSAIWRDGDVELVASVVNGPGNPRDGYGYGLSAQLRGPLGEKTGWRAEFYGGGWEPEMASPIRLNLLGVSPAGVDAIRARLRVLLPEHRDVTFEDAYAVQGLLADFDRHGHSAWVRDFLERPLVPGVPWLSAELCERKIALRGADPETARTWVRLEPFASAGWAALADAGGDADASVEAARFLAALTHPFSPVQIERAASGFPLECSALAAAMAHLFRDERWRWLDAADRDAFEARPHLWQPAPARRVAWNRPGATFDAIDIEVARVLEIPNRLGHVAGGPPLAAPGALPVRYGLGIGHSVRRAALEVASPAPRSRALAVCHVNCEDRLASFGIAWLSATAQVVWRSSLSEVEGLPVRTQVELDVIDVGDGATGDAWLAALSAVAG